MQRALRTASSRCAHHPLDASAAVALVQTTNANHSVVVERTKGKRLGLAGHAMFETYSVLTRLPGNQRVGPRQAVAIIRHNFPSSHALRASSAPDVLETLVTAEVSGGAVYDGLVALAARDADILLITCDKRALTTYARLGARFEVV